MANVKLLNFSANEIYFVNNIQKTETFELTNKCSYHLGFTPTKFCRGEMRLEVFCKNNPENFHIKIKLVGNFVREDDAPQDDVHRTSYKLLLPHARAMITALTVASNIPPIFIPDISIDSQSVYMVENPKK